MKKTKHGRKGGKSTAFIVQKNECAKRECLRFIKKKKKTKYHE